MGLSKHYDAVLTRNWKLFFPSPELEAKLENSNDERRMLVERCIASEGECEKLREKVTEHRRKLDDAQAALQELGRENQSLQVGRCDCRAGRKEDRLCR